MTRRARLIRRAALGAAIVVAMAVLGHLLLPPVTGDVLLLRPARQAAHVAATSVDLHSAEGWMTLGSMPAGSVPKAPETAEAFLARVPVGSYDRVRLAGVSIPVALAVQKDILNPLLVGVDAGRPLPDSAYGGTQAVSLGLNELSGQLKAMLPFRLVDQFGRNFTNADIAGHDVLLAAFHTSCRETCPLVAGLFLQLRQRLPPSVLLVEVTTHPSEDTPSVLRDYAGRIGPSWTFATPDPQTPAPFWNPFHSPLRTRHLHPSTPPPP